MAMLFQTSPQCFSVIMPTTYPMMPTITNVNGAHKVHPQSKSNNPIPTAPAMAPVFRPNNMAAKNNGTFPR